MARKAKTVVVNGRTFTRSQGSCSCCGARSVRDDAPLTEFPWYNYSAGIADRDGVFYSRLCGDMDGLTGCLEEIMLENAKHKATGAQKAADIIRALSGGDMDGAQADFEDLVTPEVAKSLEDIVADAQDARIRELAGEE